MAKSRPSNDVAFRRIYDDHYAAVLAYCLRRAPLEDAKDASADVFLVAWRRLDQLPGGERTLPWLYGTARKTLANQRRSRSRLMRLMTRLRFNPPPPSVPPETAVIRQQQDQEVLAALGRLKPGDREVIQLTMWEELRQAEIGELIGCSDRAVTMRLHRALRRLQHELPSSQLKSIAPALAPETEATND